MKSSLKQRHWQIYVEALEIDDLAIGGNEGIRHSGLSELKRVSFNDNATGNAKAVSKTPNSSIRNQIVFGRWNKIEVVVKKLTTSIDNKKELDLLWKLRHPNIQLFLGASSDLTNIDSFNLLVTEYIPYNLVQILENVSRLSTADILDYASDISNGLIFLHSNNLVHGNLTASNILIGSNNVAKIADFRSDLSVPSGSRLQYMSPESLEQALVTNKLDIYSFGILLIYMSSSIPPSSKEREDQLKIAASSHICLADIMVQCIDVQMNLRPTAISLNENIGKLKNNDRYYPTERLTFPLKSLSSVTRKWLDELIDDKCRDATLQVEQLSSRLCAEQARWHSEASKVDGLNNIIKDLQEKYSSLEKAYESSVRSCSKYQDDLDAALQNIATTKESNTKLSSENANLHQTIDVLKETVSSLEAVSVTKKKENDMLHDRIGFMEKKVSSHVSKEETAIVRGEELKNDLDASNELVNELEQRLAQALERWTIESASLKDEKWRNTKSKFLCASLQNKIDKLTVDCNRLRNRLSSYDNLPLAEEIQLRFDHYEADIQQTRGELSSLKSEHELLQDDHHMLNSDYNSLLAEKDTLLQEHQQTLNELKETKDLSAEYKRDCKLLRLSYSDSMTQVVALEKDKENMTIEINELKRQVAWKEKEVAGLQRRIVVLQQNGGREDDTTSSEKKDDTSTEEVASEGAKKSTNIMAILHNANQSKKVISLQDAQKEEMLLLKKREAERKRDNDAKATIRMCNGDVATIIKCMKDNDYNDIVQWRGARALRDIILQSESAKQECNKCNIEEVLIYALVKYISSDMVQSQCLRLMGTLAYGNDHTRRSAGEKGIMNCIVSALELYSDDINVLTYACTAITNLTHNSIDNRSRFIEAKGAELVITTMNRHAQSVKLQRQGCWCLLTLAGSDELSKELVNYGVISTIINAMLNHRYDSSIQQFACWAIANIGMASDEIRRKIKKAGFVEACRVALETHPIDEETQRQCRNALLIIERKKEVQSTTGH